MSELQLLQNELAQMSPEQRESWASWFRRELHELRRHEAWFEELNPAGLDELRSMVQEGIDSGDAGPLDMDEIKREARAEWEARRQRN